MAAPGDAHLEHRPDVQFTAPTRYAPEEHRYQRYFLLYFFDPVRPVYLCYMKRPPKFNLERILQKQALQPRVSVTPFLL